MIALFCTIKVYKYVKNKEEEQMTKKQKNLLIGGGLLALFLSSFVLREQNNDEMANPAGDSLAAKIAHAPLVRSYSSQATRKGSSQSHAFMLIGYDFNSATTNKAVGNTPLELNFVHRRDDDKLAVVGVTLVQGEHNDAFDRVLTAMTNDDVDVTTVDVGALLPAAALRTQPSHQVMTTTHGNEASWYRIEKPIAVSAQQMEQIHTYYANIKGV
jgi:hypothetical protein